jgi:hypothetical protein
VPWHTHSANAQVLFVSGTFQLHMKGQQVQILSQGSYAYVSANHQHQETCLDGCTYYVIREGIADVHYVDEAGREIPPDKALAAVGERPAMAEPTRLWPASDAVARGLHPHQLAARLLTHNFTNKPLLREPGIDNI